MKRNKKKFYDSYDELFIKPKKETVKIKNGQIGNRNNLFKHTGILLSFIGVVVFLVWIGGSSKKVTKEEVAVSSYDDDLDFEIMYPLRIDGVTQAKSDEIDKSKTLDLKLEGQTFISNRGYQLDMPGEVELDQLTEKEWSVVPELGEYSDRVSNIYIRLYDKGVYVDDVNISIYANVIDGMEFGLSQKSFAKAFPEPPLNDVQKGYIILHDCYYDYSTFDNLLKYYIFKDGSGIVIKFSGNNQENNLIVEEDITSDEFKELYKSDIEFLENSIVFSEIN